MVEENKNIEKMCLFFASDYHFEMITLPYINKNLKEDKNVVMITENDLNDTVHKLLSNINLNKEEKDRLSKINWKNNDLSEVEETKYNNKETIIFIKGKENYINYINKDIGSCLNCNDVKIIDCYDINEIQDGVKEITKKYGKVLSTLGVEGLV